MMVDSVARDTDYYAWLTQQARALLDEDLDELDLPNLAKEVLHLIEHEREIELRLHLDILLLHLLKWTYDPLSADKGGDCWRRIAAERPRLQGTLVMSPSLAKQVPAMIAPGYDWARRTAAKDLRWSIARFPESCPWTHEEILDLEFWPKIKKARRQKPTQASTGRIK